MIFDSCNFDGYCSFEQINVQVYLGFANSLKLQKKKNDFFQI